MMETEDYRAVFKEGYVRIIDLENGQMFDIDQKAIDQIIAIWNAFKESGLGND